MSVKVMGRVWDTDLPPNLKLVLLAFADAAEHDGTAIYPGEERLRSQTSYSRGQLYEITNKLRDLSVLVQVKKGHPGQRAEYLIDLEVLDGMCPDIGHDDPENVSGSDDNVSGPPDPSRPTLPSVKTPEHSSAVAPSSLESLKDTLVELCGEPPPQNWSLYNRIAIWIRSRDGTPDEMRYKAGCIVEEWGRKALTATSLEKYWTRYDAEVGQLTELDVEKYQAEVRTLARERRATELDAQRGLPG